MSRSASEPVSASLYQLGVASQPEKVKPAADGEATSVSSRDRQVLKLIRLWLRVPVVEPSQQQGGGVGRLTPRSTQGTPQGGVISPLLANVYLHWLDVPSAQGSGALG